MSDLKISTVLNFSKSKGFVSINPQVRINTNKYPYLTFLDKEGKAENVYFSKSSAGRVAEGQFLGKDDFKALSIAEVKNEEGEDRMKLTFSNYVSIEDMLG